MQFADIDGTRGYHAEWSQLEGTEYKQNYLSHVWGLKIHKVVIKGKKQHNSETDLHKWVGRGRG